MYHVFSKQTNKQTNKQKQNKTKQKNKTKQNNPAAQVCIFQVFFNEKRSKVFGCLNAKGWRVYFYRFCKSSYFVLWFHDFFWFPLFFRCLSFDLLISPKCHLRPFYNQPTLCIYHHTIACLPILTVMLLIAFYVQVLARLRCCTSFAHLE